VRLGTLVEDGKFNTLLDFGLDTFAIILDGLPAK
jgi:hypothetical protein